MQCQKVPILTMVLTFATLCAFDALGDVDDLRITEVDPVGSQVEVTNFSTEGFVVPNNLPFCHQNTYFSMIPSGTEFAAGESKVFAINGIYPLSPTASDIWLYRNASNFEDGANIITGMQYGGPNNGRAGLAASEGLWPSADAFVPLPANGETLQLNAMITTTPDSWTSRAATLGNFFGTGEQITNPIPEPIAMGTIPVALELVADGLVAPLGLVESDDGTGRIFINDQAGTVHILHEGSLLAEPFLDVTSRMVTLGAFGPGTFDERGLLGFAFHPDFASNGKVYTYTSEPLDGPADFTAPPGPGGGFNHQAVFAEWQVDASNPNAIDMSTRRELLRIDEPNFNHNGGTIRFGPDNLLYISLGDGGGANDPNQNAQNTDVILGNILRIDVDGNNSANGQYGIPASNPFVGTDGIDEIFAYGFRNPYKFSFDSMTGELYVADVGQNDIEEVNKDVISGGNYGWRLKEGSFFFNPSGFITTIPVVPVPPDLIDPFAEYSNSDEGIAIIGGHVYRGSAIPALEGMYVTGDWSSGFAVTDGRLFYLTPEGVFFQLNSEPLGRVVLGFGEDLDGEIYVLASGSTTPFGDTGVVLKIVPVVPPGDDLGDIDGNGVVNVADVTALAEAIVADETESLDPAIADINNDGSIDFDDVEALAAMIVNPAP